MRKTILKWLLLVALIAYAACISVWANHEADSRVVRSVDIIVASGNSPATSDITRKGVADALHKRYGNSLVGRPLHRVNTGEIESYLRNLKSLEEVHCVVMSDRRLEVRVSPMVPEIRVFVNGRSWYVNKDGKMIEADPNFFADVPVVTGRFNSTFRPNSVLPLVRFVKNDSELSQLVSMFVADGPNDLLAVPRIHGHIINFGDTTRLPEKKQALMAFYRKVIPYKGWERYDTISVKFRNQIVATRRDKSVLLHGAVVDDETDPEEATLPSLEQAEPISNTTNNTTSPGNTTSPNTSNSPNTP